MSKSGFKPRYLLYLPPIFAFVFFCLVTSFLSPYIPIVFLKYSLPFGGIGFVFAYPIARYIFRAKPSVAFDSGLIAMAWVTVAAMFVAGELRWCKLVGC
jgi:hypothetical protein